MLSNRTNIQKSIIQQEKIQKLINPNINIYPFSITLGASNISELGILPDNIRVEDFSTFKRVFTGIHTIIALWDNAYIYESNGDYLEKEHTKGNYFKCQVPRKEHSTYFEATSIDNSFLGQFDNETLTLYCEKEILELDTFKFYIVPKLKSEKWLYIQNAINYYKINGDFAYSEITLESVANKIENSGMAIEQYIHRTPAAGQGYAWPLEKGDGNFEVDNEKGKDIPINSLQIEIEGLGAFSSVVAYGRPVERGEYGNTIFNRKVVTPMLLVPYKMETPDPSPVNTKPTHESEYYFMEKGYAKLQTKYEDWKKIYSNTNYLSAQVQNSYNGVLEAEYDVTPSNPKSNGSFKNVIYDNEWEVNIRENYDVRTDNKTGQTLELKGHDLKIAEILFFNIFINSKYTTLPLTREHNVMYSLDSLPIIGGFLSRIFAGIPVGWKDQNQTVKNDGMNWIIPAGVVDYMNIRFPNSENTTIDLNVFNNQKNQTDAALYSGINSMGTILKIGITNLISFTLTSEEGEEEDFIFETQHIGQDIPVADHNKKVVEEKYKTGKLLVNANCRPVPPTADGFVIDSLQDHTLAQTNVRISFFSNDFPIWNGTYMTKSKFTGNIRDIYTIRKFSDIKESNNEIIEYPKSIVAPVPSAIPKSQIELDEVEGYHSHIFEKAERFKITDVYLNWIKILNVLEIKMEKTESTKYEAYGSGSYEVVEYKIKIRQPATQQLVKEIHNVDIYKYNNNVAQFFQDYKYLIIDSQKIELLKLQTNPNVEYSIFENDRFLNFVFDLEGKKIYSYVNVKNKFIVKYDGNRTLKFYTKLIITKEPTDKSREFTITKRVTEGKPNAYVEITSEDINRNFAFLIYNVILKPL